LIGYVNLWEEVLLPIIFILINMDVRKNWSDSEWNAYYHFLAEVFEDEDKYMSEYLADAEANY